MTDPERATIREAINEMAERARLLLVRHESLKADIAKLEALLSNDHTREGNDGYK